MLDKLAKALGLLRQEVGSLKCDVQRVGKIRQVVKHGISPDPQAIAEEAAKLIPKPKDGVSPDPQAIAEEAAKLIPEPKPGRDAIPLTVRDVADVVLAQIKKPEDGVSPCPQAIAEAAAKLVPKPKDGVSPTPEAVAKLIPPPQRGLPGKPGKDGVSVTDVQLNNNELFVFLDGKKNSVGKIKIQAATAPFRPGADTGGGSSGGIAEFEVIPVTVSRQVSSRQILICRNVALIEITLDPSAKIGDRLHVKRRVADIRLIGVIDGITDPLISALQADSVHLVFDGTDWNQL